MNREILKTAEKLAAGILTAAMSMAFVPFFGGTGQVLADDSKNAGNTWLGVAGIENPAVPDSEDSAWSGSYVYFGKYGGNPIRFRVLAKNSTAYSSEKALFLDSDEILFTDYYDDSNPYSNVWTDSDIRGVLNGSFLSTSFTSLEKSAIITSSSKGKKTYPSGSFEKYVFGTPANINNKIFLLDAFDVTNEAYGYSSDCGWTTSSDWSSGSLKHHQVANRTKRGQADIWLLRSETKSNNEFVGGVAGAGNLNSYYVNSALGGIAPALNVYQKSIIFSTLTGNGTDEYKLTLKDSSLVISVTENDKVTAEGNTITIPYTITGKNSGKATRASVLILDKEYKAGNTGNAGIIYYDELGGSFATTGTGTFKLPLSFNLNGWGTDYFVYILAEDINDEYASDYASTPVKLDAPEIKAEPTDTPTPTVAAVNMPDVYGMYYQDAIDLIKTTLKDAGFTDVNVQLGWTFSNYDPDMATKIISQDPEAGTVLYVKDKSITVTIMAAERAPVTNTPTPTNKPTAKPTKKPTATPTVKPTKKPTVTPTVKPTKKPTVTPTVKPTKKPTTTPTVKPTKKPTATPTPASKPKSTWVKEGNKWYYYDSKGSKATGWVKVGTAWYYMDSSGVMQTGWLKDGNTWYYLNSSGAMATGWVKVGTTWYYMDSSGAMKTGWVKAGTSWYYMNSSGAMLTGWQKINSKWYYFDAGGAMKTGWIQSGNNWYYLNSSGEMVTGKVTIDGRISNFDDSGIWLGYV